jgi:PAS domain S-box-containing protein
MSMTGEEASGPGVTAARGGLRPARGTGIRRRATIAAALTLVLTVAAFAVALIAAAQSESDGHQLSQRLVPASAATDEMLTEFTAQQALLRDAVSDGKASGLTAADSAGQALQQASAKLAGLGAGDQRMTAGLDAVTTAYQNWLTRVEQPQAAALRRGDAAAARALQANTAHTSSYTLAVRTSALALQAEIIGEQQSVTDGLSRIHELLLGALIAMLVVAAGVAAQIVIGVWHGLLKPFGALNAAVSAVADGRYHRRIPAVGPAELAELSRGVELMRTRLVAALTEREQAEASVRSLFDLAPDAMLAVSGDGSILMANAQAVRVFGYPVHELVGRPAEILVAQESRAGLAADAVSYFTDRRSSPPGRGRAPGHGNSARGLRRDGSTFPAEVRMSLLPTDAGTAVVLAVRDVTERLAMEAERERLRVAAEQENLQRRERQSQRLESLGQLIGGVAHDFNNLLNVISGYADFAAEQLEALAGEDVPAEPALLEPVMADVEQVRTAAEQAIRVTRQLLTFAKSETSDRLVLDLNAVVDSAGQLLRRSLGEQIELVMSAELELWPVEGDRGQLEQVLVNLALNARDAMPGGGRLTIATANAEVDAVYAEQRPHLEPGRYCRLTVSDTGEGMDAATVERVFEPFFSTKPRGRGTGLGLATVYGIVSGMGGNIDIYSEVGLGTTVSVLLPVTGQAAREPGSAAEEAGPPPAAGTDGLRGRGETILLVEDEPSLRIMASRILRRNGYRVAEAVDGSSAVWLAGALAQRFDLLVTDMVMPGMLGNEVADHVRAVRPGLPCLFITGYAQQVLDFHGIPGPDLDIVQKPFTEAGLLARVRRALDRAPSSEPG